LVWSSTCILKLMFSRKKKKKVAEVSEDEYTKARKKAEKLYSSYGKIRCPAIDNEFVNFTSEGFNHFLYSAPKKPRDKRSQMERFRLLPKGREIIEISTTYQEYEEEYKYMKVNRHGRYMDESVLVRAWGFIAMIKNSRVKVVLTQQGNGNIELLTIRPAWRIRWYRNIKLKETSTGKGLFFDGDDEN